MAVLFAYTYNLSYKYCRYTHVVTLYLSENIYISGCNSFFSILTYMLGHIFCICATNTDALATVFSTYCSFY